MSFLKIIILTSLLGSNVLVAPLLGSARIPTGIILDTDMSGDCDDVGALAILNRLDDLGEAKILACVANGHDQDRAVAASIDAINTYYGRPRIPIGTYHGPKYPSTKSPYTSHIRDEFPHTALPDDQEPKAVDIYRATLAAAHDQSVTVVSIGFLVNLEELLQSAPDTLSPLNGIELVRKKVKRLVVMGGQFPESDPHQGEYNFAGQGGGLDTQYAIEHWPTPILFTGFEIGVAIQTGTKLAAAPAADPVRRAYELYTSFKGRPSWDLTAVLAAVRDPKLYWTIKTNGYCKVHSRGANEWVRTHVGRQTYLVASAPPTIMATLLDSLLSAVPIAANDCSRKP